MDDGLRKIPNLKKGDLIYITSPAKAIEEEHVIFAKNFFESAGFKVEISKNCLGQFNYFSGTDQERLSDFQEGIDNPEIKAIVCARGGYGCIRLVDRINWAGMLRDPKWIVGFSDVTIFQQRMLKLELPSIHATMPLNFQQNSKEALTTLLGQLTGTATSIKIKPSDFNKKGNASGILVGGNLSILYSLLGTDDQIDYSNTILFIEDLAEQLYHIERMLYAFEKAGIFDKIKGLIVGGMTNLQDTAVPFGKTVEEIIVSFFEYRNTPICFNFPIGHIDDNRAIRIGENYELNIQEAVELKPLNHH